MDKIVVPMTILKKLKLTINEYFILYDIANDYVISTQFEYNSTQLITLEAKGFIKLTSDGIFLRDKASVLFSINDDYFSQWLAAYPNRVTGKYGNIRALSPETEDTIAARRLRTRWKNIFRKNIDNQKKAVEVLKLQVKQMTKDDDIGYMVGAERWLNDGYHEKYAYLVDEGQTPNKYENEDWM